MVPDEPRPQGLLDDGLPGRDDHDPRPLRLGEEHVPALPELPRGAQRRASWTSTASASPAARSRPVPPDQGADPPAPPRGRDGLPGVQPLPAPLGHREPHRGAGPHQEDAEERGDRARRGLPREGGPHREARRVPVAPVGRPAPARRDRPGADDAAQGPALRRAHERARPLPRRRGAQGHGEPRPRGPDDDRGHPRDVVREGGGRPRLLHARGRVHRDRPARAGPPDPQDERTRTFLKRFLDL